MQSTKVPFYFCEERPIGHGPFGNERMEQHCWHTDERLSAFCCWCGIDLKETVQEMPQHTGKDEERDG